MSRTTAGIMRINQELDKISGLDGIVADKIEELEKQVKIIVSDILENHSEASIFDYEGCPERVTPKETFELELTTGYKTEFVEGDVYKVSVEDSIYYVEDSHKHDIPFTEKDFMESFKAL